MSHSTQNSLSSCSRYGFKLLALYEAHGAWYPVDPQPDERGLVSANYATGIRLAQNVIAVVIGNTPEAKDLCAKLGTLDRAWWGTCRMAGPDGHILLYRGEPPADEVGVVPGVKILSKASYIPLPPTKDFKWQSQPIWQPPTKTEPTYLVGKPGEPNIPLGQTTWTSVFTDAPRWLLELIAPRPLPTPEAPSKPRFGRRVE